MEKVDVSIKWPFKWCLVGSSGSGKTEFSLQLVSNAFRLFDIPPSKLSLFTKSFKIFTTNSMNIFQQLSIKKKISIWKS